MLLLFWFLFLIVIMAFSEGVGKNFLDVCVCWDVSISFLELTDLQLWLCVKR